MFYLRNTFFVMIFFMSGVLFAQEFSSEPFVDDTELEAQYLSDGSGGSGDVLESLKQQVAILNAALSESEKLREKAEGEVEVLNTKIQAITDVENSFALRDAVEEAEDKAAESESGTVASDAPHVTQVKANELIQRAVHSWMGNNENAK